MNHVTPLKRPVRLQLAALTVAAAFSCSALLTSANAATYTWNGVENNCYGEWGGEADAGAWAPPPVNPDDPPTKPVSAADTIIKYFADNNIQLANGYILDSYPLEDFTLNRLELNGTVGATGTGDPGAAWLTLGQQGKGNFNFAGTAPRINLNAIQGVNYTLANTVTLTSNLTIGLTQPVPATSPFNAADGSGTLDFANGISGADFRLELAGVNTQANAEIAPSILEAVRSRLITLSGDTQLGELYIGAQTLGGTVAVKNGAALTVGTNGTGSLRVGESSAAQTYNGIYGALDLRDAGAVNIHVDTIGIVQYTGKLVLPYLYGKLTLGQDTTMRAKTAVRVGSLTNKGAGPMDVARGDGAFLEVMDGGIATIMTDSLLVGYGKGSGDVKLGVGATVTLAGYNAAGAVDTTQTALLSIGRATLSTTGSLVGKADFSAGTFIGYLRGIEMAMSAFAGNADGTLTGELILGSSNANFLSVIGASVMAGDPATGRNAVVTISQSRSTATALEGAGNSETAGTLTIGNLAAGSIIESLDNGTAILVAERTSKGAGNATGTLNLDGGELTIKTTGVAISGGIDPGNASGNTAQATSTVNFNGTQLIVGANSEDWIQGLTHAVIGTGGAKINTNGFTIGVSQAFSGTGDFTKSGAGTLYMNGINTYTGTTYVTGGTLGGTGTFAGAIVVSSGATLAPGQSVGTLHVGSVTLETGAILAIEVGSTTSHDIVDIAAGEVFAFATGAELHISVAAGATLQVGDTLNIFTGTGTVSGWEDITIVSDNADYSFGWTNGQLEVTAIPEPTTYGLLGAAGLAGLVVLRRRRK